MGSYQGDDDRLLEKIDTYYNEITEGQFVPRAVLVDLAPNTIDSIMTGSMRQFFKPDNIIAG